MSAADFVALKRRCAERWPDMACYLSVMKFQTVWDECAGAWRETLTVTMFDKCGEEDKNEPRS